MKKEKKPTYIVELWDCKNTSTIPILKNVIASHHNSLMFYLDVQLLSEFIKTSFHARKFGQPYTPAILQKRKEMVS